MNIKLETLIDDLKIKKGFSENEDQSTNFLIRHINSVMFQVARKIATRNTAYYLSNFSFTAASAGTSLPPTCRHIEYVEKQVDSSSGTWQLIPRLRVHDRDQWSSVEAITTNTYRVWYQRFPAALCAGTAMPFILICR